MESTTSSGPAERLMTQSVLVAVSTRRKTHQIPTSIASKQSHPGLPPLLMTARLHLHQLDQLQLLEETLLQEEIPQLGHQQPLHLQDPLQTRRTGLMKPIQPLKKPIGNTLQQLRMPPLLLKPPALWMPSILLSFQPPRPLPALEG